MHEGALDLLILLAGIWLIAVTPRPLGLRRIMGELLAGVGVGPAVLGLIGAGGADSSLRRYLARDPHGDYACFDTDVELLCCRCSSNEEGPPDRAGLRRAGHGGSGCPSVGCLRHLPVPYIWRCGMAFGRSIKLGIGAAAVAVVAVASVGFAPTQTELPTVTVYHSPT
jgi:hypothetical protein